MSQHGQGALGKKQNPVKISQAGQRASGTFCGCWAADVRALYKKNWNHLLVGNNQNSRVLICDGVKLFTLFVVMDWKLTMLRIVDLNS